MAWYIIGGAFLYSLVTVLSVALGLLLHDRWMKNHAGSVVAILIMLVAAAILGIGGYMMQGLLPE